MKLQRELIITFLLGRNRDVWTKVAPFSAFAPPRALAAWLELASAPPLCPEGKLNFNWDIIFHLIF